MEALASCSMSPFAVLARRKHHNHNHHSCHRERGGMVVLSSKTLDWSIFQSNSISVCHFHTGRIRIRSGIRLCCSSGGGGSEGDDEEDEEDEEEEVVVDRALGMDGSIPSNANELIKRVSSRAYDIRSKLKNTINSSSYDVLESNPWREDSKSVYVLTQRENQLCTMKTRRSRSEVETELEMLFSDRGKPKSNLANTGAQFRMLVEDIREGILVFEDEHDAERYCDLLRGGQGCEGIAEVDASSVFDICNKVRALAVLFRRGRTHPEPETLELNLKARNRSLEDK